MSLLFVHDHKFRMCCGKIYTSGCFDNKVLGRYTELFGKMTFAARIVHTKNVSGFPEITNTETHIEDAYHDRKKLIGLVKQADYIIIRLPSVLGIKAVRLARKYKKPYLVELVGCPWDSFWNHSLKGKAAAPFMWYLTRTIVKNAPFVIYVSEKFLQRRYPSRGKQLACSDVMLSGADDMTLIKRTSKTKTEENVLGTVAAVNLKYKGQQYVIKAISKLKKEGYKIRYRLVGNGDSAYLKKTAKKYGVLSEVEFCGPIPHDEVFDFMDNIDIYIQPSIADALPRALLEAINRACPVAGSDTGGIPELVPPECVFRKKSVSGIVRVIRNMVDTGYGEWADKSRVRAEDFDADRLEKKRNEFYKLFIQSAGIKE